MSAVRTISFLSLAMALGGSSQGLIMFSGPLVGKNLATNAALATIPVSCMLIAQVLSAMPASYLMRAKGRRFGFVLGAISGSIGSAVAGFGILANSFALFCVGLFFVGTYLAFVQQYRFAAIENVPQQWQARAISFVLLGGIFAGIAGPALAEFLKFEMSNAPYAASYWAASILGLGAICVLLAIKLKPIPKPDQNKPAPPVRELLARRAIFVPIITGAVSFSMMTFVMVAAPLAMDDHMHSSKTTSFAIQWHIVAMFAPSFITGFVIDKFGVTRVIGAGLLMLAICAIINLTGTSALHFISSLILLGVGWNFGFVGSTALLARGYKAHEATKTQALNDLIVFGAMASASILSGVLLNLLGWAQINILTIIIVIIAIIIMNLMAPKPAVNATEN